MELNFYTLSVIYLVYSFLGWVGETVVATAKGRQFTNRGVASGPFCFVYGTAGVLLAVGLADLRNNWFALFAGSFLIATVVEWVTAKLLERVHHRRWWDYSDKKFNLDGYVCLQYSALWGVLGAAAVRWGNDLLLRFCAWLPPLLLHIAVWVSMTVAVLDQIGAVVVVGQYAARHPRLEQLGQELGKGTDRLQQKIAARVERRIQRAYPAAARPEPTASAEKAMSVSDLVWLFVVGAFLGDVVETLFCRITAGVWMSRSGLGWGPFSVVWGWRWCWPPSFCGAASTRARAASSGSASSSAVRMSMCAAPSPSCCSAPCSGITAASSSTSAGASTCCIASSGALRR